ncbi:peptide-methionine (S)-S-oxide reductase [Strigomonas culicis]|uniref:peptide-methionine (S)-S-oxide reductase n=1 Tax=Strigomonas culicis TaxID=28005 RepID=S9UNK7_9TRYP|nr:peptide-methionine (S)-S-oxide reductase [Strigomonas culicis]|eukprot:EPY30319.1 peptide-methionine (S)-S-oxide reductase [Strigomonas culicis]
MRTIVTVPCCLSVLFVVPRILLIDLLAHDVRVCRSVRFSPPLFPFVSVSFFFRLVFNIHIHEGTHHLTPPPLQPVITMAPTEQATFAAGCYWGTEHHFVRKFKDALITHEVGFMGGIDKPGITYEEVKTGATNHAEVLHVTYDSSQGNLRGVGGVFFPHPQFDDAEPARPQHRHQLPELHFFIIMKSRKRIATEYLAKINGADQKLHEIYVKTFDGKPCVTILEPAGPCFPAHEAHQNYLEKVPDGYCSHRVYY